MAVATGEDRHIRSPRTSALDLRPAASLTNFDFDLRHAICIMAIERDATFLTRYSYSSGAREVKVPGHFEVRKSSSQTRSLKSPRVPDSAKGSSDPLA